MYFDQWRRRDFVVLLSSAAAAWPLAAHAQQPTDQPLVGFLNPQSAAAAEHIVGAFRRGMRDLGYVEGANVAFAFRFADGQVARLPALVNELVALKPAVIAAGSPAAVLETHKATRTIPIVIATSQDPMALGIAASMARPGGNVTGFWFGDETLIGKRLELLKHAVPGISRVGVMVNPDDAATDAGSLKALPAVARALGLAVRVLDVRVVAELEPAFAAAGREGLQGLHVSQGPLFNANRAQVTAMAARTGLPSVYGFREFATAGGLISYSASLPDIWRRNARVVDKILKGANPGDLPIERPTKFDLVVNLKTAKSMGLTIPEQFLLLADEVIE
jgi:putative tryptophan/tyrosine transport system substrate-binding protein